MIRQLQNTLSEKNGIIAEYEIVLRHIQNGLFLNERKQRNIHFHSSPQQLIATILKREPQKWLNRKDIAHQAMELDGQEVGETLYLILLIYAIVLPVIYPHYHSYIRIYIFLQKNEIFLILSQF